MLPKELIDYTWELLRKYTNDPEIISLGKVIRQDFENSTGETGIPRDELRAMCEFLDNADQVRREQIVHGLAKADMSLGDLRNGAAKLGDDIAAGIASGIVER